MGASEAKLIKPGNAENATTFEKIYLYLQIYNDEITGFSKIIDMDKTPLISYSEIHDHNVDYIQQNSGVYKEIGTKMAILAREKYISKSEIHNLFKESYKLLKDKNMIESRF